MSGRRELFGTYRPATTWLHRLPLGFKGLGILVLTICLMLPWHRWLPAWGAVIAEATRWELPGLTQSLPQWAIPLACILGVLLIGASGGIPVGSWWATLRPAIPIFLILAGYHVIVGTPQRGAAVLLTVMAAMLATRVLLETTPQAVLLDGLVKLLGPLRVMGVQPERVGLAIQIMLRAIPYLLGVVTEIRQAAKARGIRLGPVQAATPAVIAAVAHAQRTGEALVARGLD